jgi:truncated hemoglobin YjbI
VFGSDWIDGDQTLKKIVEMFMENAKKDMKISAFGVFHVNLENFRRIIHSAYSYYTFLKGMKI